MILWCALFGITISGSGNDQCPVNEDGVGEVESCGHTVSIIKVHKAHFGGHDLLITGNIVSFKFPRVARYGSQ